jgi:hypothetical protein
MSSPPSVAEHEAVISRLTRLLASAPDADVVGLVEELRAQRRDLEEARRRAGATNVVDISTRKRP